MADKWRTACAYLREDLRTGYVRILWELWAIGLAEEELAALWRDTIAGWRDLLTSVAEDWTAQLDFRLPISPRALATVVANAFQGAEAEILAGVTDEEAPHLEALESIGDLIEWAERRTGDDAGS